MRDYTTYEINCLADYIWSSNRGETQKEAVKRCTQPPSVDKESRKKLSKPSLRGKYA